MPVSKSRVAAATPLETVAPTETNAENAPTDVVTSDTTASGATKTPRAPKKAAKTRTKTEKTAAPETDEKPFDVSTLSTSEMWAREVALRPATNSNPARKSGAPAEGEFERVFALWRETGDPQLRDRLILMHRNLVSYLARRFTDRGEMYEDIIQQGLIGLINALDHFDPKRGVRFATFATPTIVGEIRRYFRDKTWSVRVPRRLQELHQTINRKIESLTQELDRSPTYAEIARALNVEEEQVVEALEMAQALDPASLDEPSSGEEGSGVAIVDQVGAHDQNLERLNEFSQLKAALEQLTPRQRTVLQLAYFEGFSQAEIARHIKVSPMHVSRLQRRALAQLREILEEAV